MLPIAKKPPTSEPQVLTPDAPIDRAWRTALRSPSYPQDVVGSPPQTTSAQAADPVQPERWKRTSSVERSRASRCAAQW